MKKMLALILALMLSLSVCAALADVPSGVEDGVLTIAMECAYAPYNWTQSDDSNGAVPISNVPGSYANGYDVMIAKRICEANGWKLEVIQSDWDSLVPGVQTGTFDAVIAGQSMTAERAEQVDFAGPYFYATIVCLTKADSPYADAQGLSDLSGGSCTAQIATIWYDSMLPQIEGLRFCIPWALILVNIGAWHLIELRARRGSLWESRQLRRKAAIILIEAALVGLTALVYALTGVSIACVPIFFGILATALSGRLNDMVPVDFPHLSERAMLYVVFTFGEMIITIAPYFAGVKSASDVFFSTAVFLIVVGLLLSYGVLYNKIIDRRFVTNGTGYMMIHVFLIFALNNISVAFDFMRDEAVDPTQKIVLLSASFVLYFTFLFLTARYAKRSCSLRLRAVLLLAVPALLFIALMLFLREYMYVNVLLTAVYVYAVFFYLYRAGNAPDVA